MMTGSTAGGFGRTGPEARTYKRDPDGQFASGGGDVGEDENVGDVDEGDYGYGRDPEGVSYTEFDVDQETGEPKFSQEYRARYGPVTSDDILHAADGGPIAIVESEKGPFLHVADDSRGTMQREVIQEFTRREAGQLGDGVYAVYSGDRPSFTTSSGVSVRPAGADPTRDGVDITWSNGRHTTFQGEAGNDAAFDLQESLAISAGTATNRLSSPLPRRRRPRNAIDPRDIDLSRVQRDFERRLDGLIAQWDDITERQRAEIVDRVRSAVTSDDLAALAAISVNVTEARETLVAAMTEMALSAAQEYSREAAQQDVGVDPVASDSATFDAVAGVVVTLLAEGLTNSAGREALHRWSPSTSGDEVAAAVGEHLASLSDTFLRDNLGGALTAAQNTGRLNTALSGPSAALYASEQMDKKTCGPCSAVNGKWIGNTDDPDIAAKVQAIYPNGGYKSCQGGVRCRGAIVAIYRPDQVTDA